MQKKRSDSEPFNPNVQSGRRGENCPEDSEDIKSSFVHSSVKEENKHGFDLEMQTASNARLSMSQHEFEMSKRIPMSSEEES